MTDLKNLKDNLGNLQNRLNKVNTNLNAIQTKLEENIEQKGAEIKELEQKVMSESTLNRIIREFNEKVGKINKESNEEVIKPVKEIIEETIPEHSHPTLDWADEDDETIDDKPTLDLTEDIQDIFTPIQSTEDINYSYKLNEEYIPKDKVIELYKKCYPLNDWFTFQYDLNLFTAEEQLNLATEKFKPPMFKKFIRWLFRINP